MIEREIARLKAERDKVQELERRVAFLEGAVVALRLERLNEVEHEWDELLERIDERMKANV